MKDFIKMTLAVLCGLFIMGFLGFFLMMGFIGAVASVGNTTPSIPRSGVLHIDMSRLAVSEQAAELDAMSVLQGNTITPIGLWDMVQAIERASADQSVQYIFIKTDGLTAGLAHIEELRQSLINFKTSGKPVIAFTENPTSGSYLLASAADKIYMGKYIGGTSMMTGVGSQMIFIKDLLDKLGVNVQLIRHGKYKSAGEMFIRNTPSPENLLQNQEMIDSIWDSIAEAICKSREISKEDLNALIDGLKLNCPQDFLDNRLVDELFTKEELKSKLTDLAVESKFEDVKMIPISDYIAAAQPSTATRKIAVVFAEGEIVDGDAANQVAGDRFARIIAKVRADSTIKAVVLRVASPGGSVLASEKIRTEVDLLRKDKPVIASYGSYAASGGYWISNSCDKIFSDATTLTGSIGVFSMIPDFSKTAENLLNVNITSVGSSKHSDMFSLMRPLDNEETDFMQSSVETIYNAFIKNVSEGRKMSEDDVDKIAQGRVWSGADALEIGLVDEIGTLADAINYAAVAAGDSDCNLSTWNVECHPKPLTTFEMLLENLSGKSPEVFANTPFESIELAFRDWKKNESFGKVYARMPYLITIQ